MKHINLNGLCTVTVKILVSEHRLNSSSADKIQCKVFNLLPQNLKFLEF